MKKGVTFWKKVRLAVVYAAWPTVLLVIAGGVLFSLLWFKLGTLLPGLSPSEAIIQRHLALQDISLRSILDNPLFLPYSLVLYALQSLGLHGTLAVRGISAFIGTLTVICFYLIIRRWHTPRLAIFGTIMFAASSWFLNTARYGSADIMFSGIIFVLLAAILLQQSKHRKIMLTLTIFIGACYIYVPGMIWFLAIAGIWQSKRIRNELKRIPTWFTVVIALGGVIVIAPLVWGIYHTPSLVLPLLGLPNTLPNIADILQNIINIPTYIFVRGPNDPARWLPGTAYLDIFSSMMLFVGLYWAFFKRKLDRIRAITGLLLVGSLLVATGGPVNMALLIPFIYLLITAGMTFMLQQWFTVFPRNPIARTIGTSLLSLAVLASVFYNINHYFIAWPNTPSVRKIYSTQPLIIK